MISRVRVRPLAGLLVLVAIASPASAKTQSASSSSRIAGPRYGASAFSDADWYGSVKLALELQPWNIDKELIPAGTPILFRDPSIWEEYRVYILGAIALMLLQFALIGGLLLQRIRRRRIEANLRESEQRYRVTAEENQDLSGRLINAQEEERTRIARDLHDDVSQQIAVVGIVLSGLKRMIGQSGLRPEVVHTLNTLQERNVALANSVRSISDGLHPSVLQHAGLNATLKRHCAEIEQHHQVKVAFSASDDLDSLSPNVALCLFRVAQEALTNAVRHARARTIRVRLAAQNGSIELGIMDDGVGFVPEDRSRDGLGLRSIDERVRLVGGTVKLESRPGQGTSLLVNVPLAGVPGNVPVATEAALDRLDESGRLRPIEMIK